MEYLIGAVLALSVSMSATRIGFDRQRVFYPTLVIVIASYYALFAVVGDSALALELAAMLGFVAVTILAFKTTLWWIVVALVAHGLFDVVHALLINDPGVPRWWPGFCLTYDVVAGAYLAGLLISRRVTSTPEAGKSVRG